MEETDEKELINSLQPYFNIAENAIETKEAAYERLLNYIANEIQYLIDYNLDKLWSLLYRIDVSEKKVREMIATTPFTEHAKKIAELIIARQLQKIDSRKKYK